MDAVRRFLWTPIGWFSFLAAEFAVVLVLERLLLPDHAARWIVVGALVVVLAGLTVFNVWFRRRFVAWDEPTERGDRPSSG
jgi:hypothetical protein